MKLTELQKEVDTYITTIGVRYFHEMTNMAILTEEVGEVARIMSRLYGEQSFKENTTEEEAKRRLADELADVLFVLTCIANQTGINLETAMMNNLLKKQTRDIDRHKNNTKLN